MDDDDDTRALYQQVTERLRAATDRYLAALHADDQAAQRAGLSECVCRDPRCHHRNTAHDADGICMICEPRRQCWR